MGTRLTALCFDANDPLVLARFWAGALGWTIEDEDGDDDGLVTVVPTDGTPFDLDFAPVPEPKAGKSRVHLDLVADLVEDQVVMVERLVGLGACHVDIGQRTEAGHVVLADPEGNELCVVVRGEFLATTGVLGAVVFEPAGYPDVGRFWSEATGWPIVFDDGGDVAIRHPDGTGPFITFGPPVDDAKAGKNRLHLDVAPHAGDDQEAEVERLLALGGRRLDIGQGHVSWVVLADPDGNELCVLSPR